MSKEMIIFENEDFGRVRVVEIDNEPWFVAKDVAKILCYSDTFELTKRLDNDEKVVKPIEFIRNLQNAGIDDSVMRLTFINESGLYNSIIGSKKQEAKRFKKWITSEVLPSIRKTGSYSTNSLTVLDLFETQVKVLREQEAKLKELEMKQQIQAEQIKQIQAKTATSETDYFSIMGYAILNELKGISLEIAKNLGKEASKLSKEQQVPVTYVKDQRFGKVGAYHIDILNEVFLNNNLINDTTNFK